MKPLAPVIFLSLILASCMQQIEPASNDTLDQLNTLIEEEWDFRLKENPLLATAVGRHDYNELLPAVTEDDQARRYAYYVSLKEKLNALERQALSGQDLINLELLLYVVEDNIANYEYQAYLVPILADAGFHFSFARLPFNVPLQTEEDYSNYIQRLQGAPSYFRQHITLMRRGIDLGITMPRIVLAGYEGTIDGHIVEDATESTFYQPFLNMPEAFGETTEESLMQAGQAAVMDSTVYAYKLFLDFMVNEYIPAARTTLGAHDLPNGEKYYGQRINYFTTLPMDVAEIHDKGLEEVSRIKSEMQAIIDKVGFDGSFADFLEFLRTDERFYAKTPEDLLKQASFISKRMDGKLPALFNKLPRLPYTVEAVPAEIAPKYTGGRYVPPSAGSTQPGRYWVNTYKLENRPLYVLESLSLHEAVPGHHLQGALSRELVGLPEFRKLLYISAFGEGWGLYSEWLGLEAGFYQDPYSDFGRLTYEMWRACRLVVDTGIHAKGWTRQQVIDYLSSNTALSIHECTTETDRYISWPGQALSYKIGELKIKELREKASTQLGSEFDLREFHDKILENGAVTLPILERVIDEYINEKSSTQ